MLVPLQHPTTREIVRVDVPTKPVTEYWHIESYRDMLHAAKSVGMPIPETSSVKQIAVVYAPVGMIAGWVYGLQNAVALAHKLAALYDGPDMSTTDTDTRHRMMLAITEACNMPMPRKPSYELTPVP